MKKWMKYGFIGLTCILVLGYFVFILNIFPGVYGEEPIKITGNKPEGVKVTASSFPDFRNIGRAWVIKVQNKVPFLMGIENDVAIFLPGNHKIYANHDSSIIQAYFKNYKGISVPEFIKIAEANTLEQ